MSKEAEDFANSMPKFKESVPRTVSNPGLYYGFLAGASSRDKEIKELKEKYLDVCKDLYKFNSGSEPD